MPWEPHAYALQQAHHKGDGWRDAAESFVLTRLQVETDRHGAGPSDLLGSDLCIYTTDALGVSSPSWASPSRFQLVDITRSTDMSFPSGL